MAIGWTFAIGILCLISFEKLPDVSIRIANADKYVHATFHFIFTLLWFLYFKSSRPKVPYLQMLLLAVLMSIAYGALIELLQQIYTSTRRADLKDILANMTGAFLAAMTAIFLRTRITKTLFYK